MIPSLIQCNSYILIYQFQLLKINWGEVFMISSFQHSATVTSSLISFNYQNSKKGIYKLSNCNREWWSKLFILISD